MFWKGPTPTDEVSDDCGQKAITKVNTSDQAQQTRQNTIKKNRVQTVSCKGGKIRLYSLPVDWLMIG